MGLGKVTSQPFPMCGVLGVWLMYMCSQRTKLDDKEIKCIFFGYSVENRIYEPSSRRVVVSRDVIFDETSSMPLQDCKLQSTLGVSDIFDSRVPVLHSDAYEDAPQGTSSPSTAHLQPYTQFGQPHVLTEMPPAT